MSSEQWHKLARVLLPVWIGGCASLPIDQVQLMPAPDVYGDGIINPLPEQLPWESIPYDGILYATDRAPATEEDKENYYLNDRGEFLRVGAARVVLGKKEMEWETARLVSMLKARTEEYPIKVKGVEEWGVIPRTVPYWIDWDIELEDRPVDATERFTAAIDAQMANSGTNDVFIYVHGYKVVYENPILVSSELWHFLGYEGAFIAYAWPSTPSKFAYIKDSDTSAGYARNFRSLLETVARDTNVENIHVIGYSNGTRLVTRALEQLALIHSGKTREQIREEVKLENVILVGSDLDRGVFGSYMADGLLDVTSHLSVYMSEYDKALGVSQFLTRRERLGQLWGAAGGKEMRPSVRQALENLKDRISFINVSPAEGAGTGNGHGYFRSSPWASSDVLMTLYYSLDPWERGLVQQDDMPVYTFPDDYIDRLWDAIKEVDPEFAERLKQRRAEIVAVE